MWSTVSANNWTVLAKMHSARSIAAHARRRSHSLCKSDIVLAFAGCQDKVLIVGWAVSCSYRMAATARMAFPHSLWKDKDVVCCLVNVFDLSLCLVTEVADALIQRGHPHSKASSTRPAATSFSKSNNFPTTRSWEQFDTETSCMCVRGKVRWQRSCCAAVSVRELSRLRLVEL